MSWKKVRLGDILKQYRIEHRVEDKTTYKQVSILNDGSVVLRGEKIGKEIGRKRQFKIDTKKYPNTLIFTRQLLLQGSIGIASDNVHECIVTENMPMFSIDTIKIDMEFLILFLKSEIFKSRIREIELSGSAQKSIHERTFLNLEFSIPPFELQKTKVVELLKLKSNSDRITAELTHQLSLVKKLRQQLLQDAVQGKLVEQNNNDEPASELLKKIKAEKEQLIKAGKLKKEKELPVIKEDEIPFEIPKGWVWCRLGEIVSLITSGSRDWNKYYANEGVLFIRSQNIKPTYIDLTKQAFVKLPNSTEGKRTAVEKDDILITITGAGVSNAGLLTNMYFDEGYISQHVALIRLMASSIAYWVHFCIISDCIGKTQFSKMIYGDKPGLNLVQLKSLLIPLPPILEQNRIVQKLDELMQYCNDLEASIKESAAQNEKLLQQVLREALRKEPVTL